MIDKYAYHLMFDVSNGKWCLNLNENPLNKIDKSQKKKEESPFKSVKYSSYNLAICQTSPNFLSSTDGHHGAVAIIISTTCYACEINNL